MDASVVTHRSPKTHRDPPTSPPPWQDWDSFEVEPEPVDERVPRHDPPSLDVETPGVIRLALLLAAIALLDGITNVVVRDDSQVAGIQAWKVYESDERRPGVQVRLARGKETR